MHGSAVKVNIHCGDTMRRFRMAIVVINALLLQSATAFHQINFKYLSRRIQLPEPTIWKKQRDLTKSQWLPSNAFNVVCISSLIVKKSAVFVLASSNSKIDTRADSEIICSTVIQSVRKLCASGSDIRGRFVDHDESVGSLLEAIQGSEAVSNQPALTPFAACCIGYSYARTILASLPHSSQATICIGIDPRTHGIRLAEAFAFGARSYLTSDTVNQGNLSIVFTGIATTPACASFVRSQQCDGAVMITASHLPNDRNGFKFFATFAPSGFTRAQIQGIGEIAEKYALECLEMTKLHSYSSLNVISALHVDWMSLYADALKNAVLIKTQGVVQHDARPLAGLKLILNPGNGAGGFFQAVLEDLGADVSASIHLEPDGSFPNGIPNPEDVKMLEQTLSVCESEQADLGIMLDTDADRCGFVVPRIINVDTGVRSNYEPLNRNRLIALMGFIFAKEKPGCAVVTDSVTSEGLSVFLKDKLGLRHIRYIKGYANVIGKARQLTASGEVNAELAIETSGHCAMRENGYLDDGTYTAVKIVSLLAQQRAVALSNDQSSTLLHLISDMSELDEVCELRMSTIDATLDTMEEIFVHCTSEIERFCSTSNAWKVDQENLEGVRLRLGSKGQFFMIRKSLHDPIISLQIEAQSKDEARTLIVKPLIKLLEANENICRKLNIDVLLGY